MAIAAVLSVVLGALVGPLLLKWARLHKGTLDRFARKISWIFVPLILLAVGVLFPIPSSFKSLAVVTYIVLCFVWWILVKTGIARWPPEAMRRGYGEGDETTAEGFLRIRDTSVAPELRVDHKSNDEVVREAGERLKQ